jgi:hypothetical protein
MSARVHVSGFGGPVTPDTDGPVATIASASADTTGFTHLIIANRQQGMDIILAVQHAMKHMPALEKVG